MSGRLGLFEGVGVELEYMIVDAETLEVRPLADRVLAAEAGWPASEVRRGEISWSNELPLHLLELKTSGPAEALAGLAAAFQRDVVRVNGLLEGMGARLMPTGMHPFMDPDSETELWPHECNEVYRAYDRIFGCRGHGWSNLQSTHLNLPFADDTEFAALHTAVRAVLPIIPALAASSPMQDGRWAAWLDGRVAHYGRNAVRVPSVTGLVIPDAIRDRASYEAHVLETIYADLAPLDPGGTLRHEWVNARGAIPRFDRGSVEVRLIDSQESTVGDLAVAAAISAAIRWLTLDPPAGFDALKRVPTPELASILARTTRSGDRATIPGRAYLALFGVDRSAASAAELWRHVIESTLARQAGGDEWLPALEIVLDHGCLARRIREAVGAQPSRGRVLATYTRLCGCLADGTIFRAADS